jgi:hypothetical protein
MRTPTGVHVGGLACAFVAVCSVHPTRRIVSSSDELRREQGGRVPVLSLSRAQGPQTAVFSASVSTPSGADVFHGAGGAREAWAA